MGYMLQYGEEKPPKEYIIIIESSLYIDVFVTVLLISCHHYVPVLTDELLR